MSAVPLSFLSGAPYVLAAGLCWSFTGVFVRLAPHLNSWQFLTFRGLGVACAFALLWRLRASGNVFAALVRLGGTGVVVTIALGVAAIGFIVAMKLTTVANALFLSSCSPLLSAILGYAVLGERLSWHQVGSVVLGFAGLGIIVGGGIETGNWLGNACAFASALGFAAGSVAMRKSGGEDFTPALFGYGFFTAILAALVCLSTGATLAPSPGETLAAFVAGFLLMGLGFTAFLRGAPQVPAVGQTVLAQTETVFGPLWVWLAFNEAPSTATLIGGAVILVAVVAMALGGAPPLGANATN